MRASSPHALQRRFDGDEIEIMDAVGKPFRAAISGTGDDAVLHTRDPEIALRFASEIGAHHAAELTNLGLLEQARRDGEMFERSLVGG